LTRVYVAWIEGTPESEQVEIYKSLGLFKITEGEQCKWRSTAWKQKFTDKGWYMLAMYDIARMGYVSFYKNNTPFIVLALTSYNIVFGE
jgi:hypothetical protein